MNKPKTYREIENFLDKRRNFEKILQPPKGEFLTLQRIEGLLALLGGPEKAVKAFHVGGTKGKGSTAYFLEAAFIQAGFTPGLYVSPHLEQLFERIRTGGRLPRTLDLAAAFKHLRRAVEELDIAGEPPTFFEILTALAFLLFARVEVDASIIEVGLGGKLDATNVVTPLASIITNVKLEHTGYLGNTVEEIASEKAGIIKPGVPVVTAAEGGALRVIRGTAKRMNAKLHVLGRDFIIRKSRTPGEFLFKGTRFSLDKIRLGAPGAHQAVNAACALEALGIAGKSFKGLLAKKDLRCALLAAKPPGRAEVLRKTPMVVVDSAHTADSAAALADVIRSIDPGRKKKRVLIFSAMRDKDIPEIMKPLIREFDAFIFTDTGVERSEKPGRLADAFAKLSGKASFPVKDIKAAHSLALKLAGKAGLIATAGSFYLAGKLRGMDWKIKNA